MVTIAPRARELLGSTPITQQQSFPGKRCSPRLARVRTERMLRDTHIATHPRDQRRVDLVAAPGSRSVGARRGVPLFADVTVVSVCKKDRTARPGAAMASGRVLAGAVRTKRRTYNDVHSSAQACLLVLGCEVLWQMDGRRGAPHP